jgi:trigger factor
LVTVSTRPEPGSKMVLEIEVTPDEVDRHFATAYRHVAERTRVPGFRPGKAPRQVIDELREQQATLRPIDGRGAVNGDIASVKFVGTIDGEPFEGGSADRLPLVIGEDRMIPGWEANLVGMEIGETKGFDITFADDYRVEELRGKEAHFDVEVLDLREKLLPEVTDEFAKSVGDVETIDDLRAEIRDAMEKRAAAEARHAFGDRIIDFAASNASVELPEVMVANEIEIMRDELRTRLAQQRIGMEQYLALVKQSPEELATELREPATRRVKTLLVLSAIAEREGVDATDEEIDAEIAQQLERYGEDAKLREYLTGRRGRSYLRMTLRNRTLVDRLIERALGTDASAGESPTDEPATADTTEQPEEST